MFNSLPSVIVLSILFGLTVFAQEPYQNDRGKGAQPGAVMCELRGFNLTDKFLEVRYQIRNHSANDIWICDDLTPTGPAFEAQLLEENQTLLVRRRLDVPTQAHWAFPPIGRYTRLARGQSRTESLLLLLPVQRRIVFLGLGIPQSESAKRILIEIGYYSGDLPETIRRLLTDAKDSGGNGTAESLARLRRHLSLPFFNELNEHLRNRNEEVVVPYTWQGLTGEDVLQIHVEDVCIPCLAYLGGVPSLAPDLTACTRLEIQYQQSLLHYFFPYADEQNLLNRLEKDHLGLQKCTVIDDADSLRILSHEILTGGLGSGFIIEGNAAYVKCYDDEKLLTCLSVYGNTDIETDERNRFRYRAGLQSLRAHVPALQPFEMRVRCAANLKDLWYRFRLYQRVRNPESGAVPEEDGFGYPAPTAWCDEMMAAYRVTGMLDENIRKPLLCPSSDGKESSYAMNPGCEPDSSADTVLLFETKAGWNQHGGAKLFTFDNHDPRGGLVLLNDGTVKFIRTEEELKRLRWKSRRKGPGSEW